MSSSDRECSIGLRVEPEIVGVAVAAEGGRPVSDDRKCGRRGIAGGIEPFLASDSAFLHQDILMQISSQAYSHGDRLDGA